MTWGMIRDGALLLQGGKVLEMGPSRRLENLTVARGAWEIDAAGRVVLPGFVEGRTQPLIQQARPGSAEKAARCAALASDRGTQRPAFRTAAARAQAVLARMARHGTTTASAVAMPALDRAAALKTLRIFADAEGKH